MPTNSLDDNIFLTESTVYEYKMIVPTPITGTNV